MPKQQNTIQKYGVHFVLLNFFSGCGEHPGVWLTIYNVALGKNVFLLS